MFITARNKTGLSREAAAERLDLGNKTLYSYEYSQTIVPPETALRMQDVYRDPTFTARYCSDYCPIGQVYAHAVSKDANLCGAVLGLLKEQNDFAKVRDSLIEIAADGVITPEEMPEFKGIVEELLDMERRLEEIKMVAAAYTSIPAMMLERKRPLVTAAR